MASMQPTASNEGLLLTSTSKPPGNPGRGTQLILLTAEQPGAQILDMLHRSPSWLLVGRLRRLCLQLKSWGNVYLREKWRRTKVFLSGFEDSFRVGTNPVRRSGRSGWFAESWLSIPKEKWRAWVCSRFPRELGGREWQIRLCSLPSR